MNHWDAVKTFYAQHRRAILGVQANEWGILPYEWGELINLTPIEYWLWGDIRDANLVLYPQYPVDRFFVDYANPVAKVAIECDGAAYHLDTEKDRARDARLRSLGWSVYRFTGSECRRELEDSTTGEAREVLEMIGRRHGIIRATKTGAIDSFDAVRGLINNILAANPEEMS